MNQRFTDYRGRRFMAVVGSRDAPAEALSLIEEIGECLCDSGIAISSGDADGCDRQGVIGAMRSPSWELVGARVYLPWNGIVYKNGFQRWADEHIYFDATRFNNYEQAKQLAFTARGSFEGLGKGGIAMHSRNSYQVLLDNLATPVGGVICWAKPVGKKGTVRGGTNTAVQIAIRHNIPVINLATDEGMERALKFLEKKRKELDSSEKRRKS